MRKKLILNVEEELYETIRQLAAEDGRSMNSWCHRVLAMKVREIEKEE